VIIIVFVNDYFRLGYGEGRVYLGVHISWWHACVSNSDWNPITL